METDQRVEEEKGCNHKHSVFEIEGVPDRTLYALELQIEELALKDVGQLYEILYGLEGVPEEESHLTKAYIHAVMQDMSTKPEFIAMVHGGLLTHKLFGGEVLASAICTMAKYVSAGTLVRTKGFLADKANGNPIRGNEEEKDLPPEEQARITEERARDMAKVFDERMEFLAEKRKEAQAFLAEHEMKGYA